MISLLQTDDSDTAGIPSVQLYLDMFSLGTSDRRFSAGKCWVDIFLRDKKKIKRDKFFRSPFANFVLTDFTAIVGGCVDYVTR